MSMAQKNRQAAESRRAQVADLLMRRWTHGEIADELGVARITISRDVLALRQEWAKTLDEGRDVLVSRELQHIDSLERRILHDYPSAAPGERMAYMGRMTALMDKRMKLLGLETAPGKNPYGGAEPEENTTKEPIRVEISIIQAGNKELVDEPDDDGEDDGLEDEPEVLLP